MPGKIMGILMPNRSVIAVFTIASKYENCHFTDYSCFRLETRRL
jgi:hypothetical protein